MPQFFKATGSFVDKANQSTSTALNFSKLDIKAWIENPAIAGPVHDWLVAVEAVTLLNVTKSAAGSDVPAIAPALPTDDQAYRSSKLTVNYYDTVNGKKYHFTIGGRDATKYNTYPASKNVILTVADGGTAEIEALVTATEDGLSPDGNAIVVSSIVISGGKQ